MVEKTWGWNPFSQKRLSSDHLALCNPNTGFCCTCWSPLAIAWLPSLTPLNTCANLKSKLNHRLLAFKRQPFPLCSEHPLSPLLTHYSQAAERYSTINAMWAGMYRGEVCMIVCQSVVPVSNSLGSGTTSSSYFILHCLWLLMQPHV